MAIRRDWARYGKNRRNMTMFGGIWQGLVSFGEIRRDLSTFGHILQDAAIRGATCQYFPRFGRILQDSGGDLSLSPRMGIYGKISQRLAKFVAIWRDLDLSRFCKIWQYMETYEAIWRFGAIRHDLTRADKI